MNATPQTQPTQPPQETPSAPEAFTICDESSANWYARKLATIEAERARVKAQAAALLAQLDSDESRLRHLFEAQAREWAREELARRGGRRRSLTLLQGTFAFRTVPPALRVDDPEAALSYAERRAAFKGDPHAAGMTGPATFPHCARLEPVFDAATYRKAAADWFAQTGEILPGCVFDGEREHFAIRFGKDAAAADRAAE